ncbi:hypothetical protein IHE44_0011714 [Lamprotornis superbus]|uniref:GTP-binding protein Rit2 n=1 Tax=Lamprotornis superbus TaxID=245042 RepID=A0A835TNL2_9PASS|nr:hypothetical protein IHE44_0011714 [Lamprotornis superbus]
MLLLTGMHYLLARVTGTELINLVTGIWEPLAQTITVDSCKLLVPESSSADLCSAAEDFSDAFSYSEGASLSRTNNVLKRGQTIITQQGTPGQKINGPAMGAGPDAMTMQFISHRFPDYHDPTIEDAYKTQVRIDDEPAYLDILDTAGQAEFTAMRDQYMRGGEGFIICYSITDRQSFQEAAEFKELIYRVRHTYDIPVVLVGNKIDLEEFRQKKFSKSHSFYRGKTLQALNFHQNKSFYLSLTIYVKYEPVKRIKIERGLDQQEDRLEITLLEFKVYFRLNSHVLSEMSTQNSALYKRRLFQLCWFHRERADS